MDRKDDDTPSTDDVETVQLEALRPEGYDGSCLRPLGMCDLGSCDVCWYSPDHERFRGKREGKQRGST